jgi:hypothetical protein
MKPFRSQYVECKKAGFHGKGTPLHAPEDLPLMIKGLDAKKLERMCTVACLRFGGICHTGNAACVEMRSLS